jgi:exoribonuclease R
MQFHKEYDNGIDENIKEGILKYDNIYYVNNTEIINSNRAIINDVVYYKDNNIINIKERSFDNIIGILYIDSKIKYGSIGDKELYLFKSTKKGYPNFYVPYKKNKILQKIYVIIKFKEWKITDKLPIGQLIDNIGIVGDEMVEYEHLRYYYNVKNNVWKHDIDKVKSDEKILEKLQSEEHDYEIFSIDPLGSLDIDDAFHFKVFDTYYEVGIHIAYPAKFFEDQLLNILDRVSTIYFPNKKYNLLPNIYSDNYISLLENKKRYSLSVILHFEKNNNNIINSTIKECVVLNIKNYNYEEFDKIYENNNNLVDFVNFSNKLFNVINDSHKLVENWMIYTNKYIAKKLIDKKLFNIILRKHDKKYDFKILNNNTILNDEKLNNYLKIKNENSASYEIFKNDDTSNYKHSKLGNEYYTHFTSPIRRAIDFFIHLILIKGDILENNKLEKIINKINIFTKNSRKLDRNIKRLNFLFTHKKLDNIITYAYIICINLKSIIIYIPEYNLEEKIILISKKFEKIAETHYEKKDDIITNINYKIDDFNIEYYLYQKINIKLWIFTSFENIFDKLKIEILE